MRIHLSHWLLSITAAGLLTGCTPVRHTLPPAQRLMEPGPGVGGPGPGVLAPPPINPAGGYGAMMPAGGDIAQAGFADGCGPDGAMAGGVMMAGGMMPAPIPTVQVTFGKPEAMHITYDATGGGQFDSQPLVLPARQNFPQGGLYRLKLTEIAGREGVELYPTVEIAPATPRTGAYLAHNSIPVQFTEEDFDQVLSGNFVTKVIYLPDPEFQGQALAGIDTLVSTRLDPGVDPIVEADRRGTIMSIVRLGDKDIEMVGADAGMGMGLGMMSSGMMMGDGAGPGGQCGPGGMGGPGCMPGGLPGQIAGITAPMYGMPITGTPIGLPGPPHIPLGVPAGLQRHVMKNHTPMHLPDPVETMKIGVRQTPGYSYPHPVSHIKISEQNIHPGVPHGRPEGYMHSQAVDPNCRN
jgi:hypothetical protein